MLQKVCSQHRWQDGEWVCYYMGLGQEKYHSKQDLFTPVYERAIKISYNYLLIPCLLIQSQSNSGQNLIYGGPQVGIFGLIVAFLVQGVITTSLSELASAFPVSPNMGRVVSTVFGI